MDRRRETNVQRVYLNLSAIRQAFKWANVCVRKWLTQHPLHDQHLSPGELGGFDPEHLSRVICDSLIGQVLDPFKAVGSVDNQQAEEEGEGDSVRHKLHEGASQDLTKLKVKIIFPVRFM